MKTYTVLDQGKPIATKITSKQVAELLNMPSKAVYNYASAGYTYNNRFTIDEDGEASVKKEQRITPSLVAEWDDMMKAAELIRTGKGRIVTKRVGKELVKYTEVIK